MILVYFGNKTLSARLRPWPSIEISRDLVSLFTLGINVDPNTSTRSPVSIRPQCTNAYERTTTWRQRWFIYKPTDPIFRETPGLVVSHESSAARAPVNKDGGELQLTDHQTSTGNAVSDPLTLWQPLHTPHTGSRLWVETFVLFSRETWRSNLQRTLTLNSLNCGLLGGNVTNALLSVLPWILKISIFSYVPYSILWALRLNRFTRTLILLKMQKVWISNKC